MLQRASFSFILQAALTGVLMVAFPCSAEETAARGRAVFDRHKDAVVTVRTVVGISFGGQEEESEQEANATIIQPDGLAVLALSAVDPMHLYAAFRGGEDDGMTTRIVSMRIMFADGTEMPVEVVLRDKELDLVFVRPVQPLEKPLPFVDMEKTALPQMLDEVLVILQHGRVARREHAAFLARIETRVERPRLFYAIGEPRATEVVCSPVFTLDGGFVGIGVMRSVSGAEDISRDNIMVVIVPGEQIRELMGQIPPRT